MPFRLVLSEKLLEEMMAQAEAARPLECCGLLAGVLERPAEGSDAPPRGLVKRRYPLVNAAASPVLARHERRTASRAPECPVARSRQTWLNRSDNDFRQQQPGPLPDGVLGRPTRPKDTADGD